MGSGRGRTQRVQTQSAGVPQALEQRLQKKTFYSADGKPFVVFGAGLVDQNTIDQMTRAMNIPVVRKGSLQADGHYGYGLSIGGVVALDNAVSPAAVGYDQACGVRAGRLNIKFSEIEKDLKAYLHEMTRRIPIGLGQEHAKPIDHPIFDRDEWDEEPFSTILNRDGESLKEVARRQLSSCGSGNHFYEVLEDDEGNAWTLIHFGSRSPGYKTAEHFINLAKSENDDPSGLAWMSMDGGAGQAYWHAHAFARDFAYAGRDLVAEQMCEALGAEEVESVHNHHNFLEVEQHDGEALFVHRKGATPANKDQMGIIPGSMGDSSYVVRGLGNEESLRSSSHGAGRVMSRTAAHGKWDKKKRDWKTRPRVTEGAMKAWLKEQGVVLLGGDLDESPHVYKRIDEVMAAQTELVEPVVRLHPRGVVMSPPDKRKNKMRMNSRPIDDSSLKTTSF